jgi:hypothetical protein
MMNAPVELAVKPRVAVDGPVELTFRLLVPIGINALLIEPGVYGIEIGLPTRTPPPVSVPVGP